MRLFFAAVPPEDVRSEVARVQADLRDRVGASGVRWTRPEQFHFTLKFLGETPEERIPEAIEAARETASATSPFSLTLAHVGALPDARHPRTIFVGVGEKVAEGLPVLRALAEYLSGALERRGFPADTRPFRAHLTVARIGSQAGANSVSRALAPRAAEVYNVDRIGAFALADFVLMHSVLGPKGSEYTIVESFQLAPFTAQRGEA